MHTFPNARKRLDSILSAAAGHRLLILMLVDDRASIGRRRRGIVPLGDNRFLVAQSIGKPLRHAADVASRANRCTRGSLISA